MNTNKMFNCSSCGPVEYALVYGDWVDPNLKGIVFEIIRPTSEDFSAKILTESSNTKLEGIEIPKYLARVEDYCVDTRKFQCSVCKVLFKVPAPIPKIEEQVPTPGPTGPQPTSLGQIFGGSLATQNFSLRDVLEKLSDSDLDAALKNAGDDPSKYSTRDEKLDALTDHLS